MGANSHIEWTEATWNPITGCSKVSAGCKNCYAERLAFRLQSMNNPRYRNGFGLTLHEDLADLPKRWREPRLIFVNSMSDLFHDHVPLEFIRRLFGTMRECPQHTFQILTKRSARLRTLASQFDWPSNVWMGVSVEDSRVLSRVDDLRRVPAKIRFLSCEPLIGSLAGIDLTNIHWVIVGGESGFGARPMKIEWVREIFRACRKADVPFFFKQWGGVRKHVTGRRLNGKTYDEMPLRVAA
jgi:protein gp37